MSIEGHGHFLTLAQGCVHTKFKPDFLRIYCAVLNQILYESFRYKEMKRTWVDKALFFLILCLRIFFQNIKVGGGEKIKIKITKKIFLFNLKHIWIGEKK